MTKQKYDAEVVTTMQDANGNVANADATIQVASMVDAIARTFDYTIVQLVRLRNVRYADAINHLEHESEQLSKEYDQLEVAISGIQAILPSKERLTQHEADELLLSGKPDAVAAKLAELEEFKRKPIAMRQRQGECIDRLDAIGKEKRDIARQVFEDWLEAVQPVIRAAEHGLFITLLDGLEQSFYSFQEHTGTGMADNRQRPLLNQGHISGLTADDRSAEWKSGTRRYGR